MKFEKNATLLIKKKLLMYRCIEICSDSYLLTLHNERSQMLVG